ncbi:MAG: DUF2761 domain-containing protein [Pseudomonadota bacterium]
MEIETVPHAKKTWPSGLTSFEDGVHLRAEECGRQEVTIEGALAAQCDMPLYAWIPGEAGLGLDPWRYLEGLDPMRDGTAVDVWFESGSCVRVDRDDSRIRFFVDAKNLKAAA